MIFQLRSTMTFEPFVRFWRFFCKLLTFSFPFQIKKEKFKKIQNFEINSKMRFSTKKPQNWPINIKRNVGLGISDPKLRKYDTSIALTDLLLTSAIYVLVSKDNRIVFNQSLKWVYGESVAEILPRLKTVDAYHQ